MTPAALDFGLNEEGRLNTESWIIEEQGAAEKDLLAILGDGVILLERQKESLILELPIAMMALHAVSGVASGFAGRLWYDKWRDRATRKKLNELVSQIPLISDLTDKVDEQVIRRDVVEALMIEGLTSDQAENLTERIMARVKSRTATENPQEPDDPS